MTSSTRLWRTQEREQAHAECATWVLIHCLAVALAGAGKPELSQIEFGEYEDFDLNGVLSRLGQFGSTKIVGSCLSWLTITKQHLAVPFGMEIKMEFATLNEVLFLFSRLERASFRGASLNDVRVYKCFVDNCDFAQSRIKGLVIHISRFLNCDYTNAVIANAIISPLSYAMMGANEVEAFRNNMSLLTTPAIGGQDVLEVLSTRVEQLGGLPVSESLSLVPDFR